MMTTGTAQRPQGPADVVALLKQGKAAAARDLGDRLLAGRSGDPALLHLVGVAHCQSGSFDRGIALFRQAVALRPQDDALRQNLLRALMDAKRWDEAEAILRALPNAGPDIARLRADIAKGQGKFAEAAAIYGEIVDRNPADFEAWNNLGTTHLEAGAVEPAIEALSRARALNGESLIVRRNLARALIAAEREKDAVAELEAAIRIDTQDPALLLEFGQLLTRIGQAEAALPVLGDAARLDRTNAEIYVAIGLAFAAQGEFDRAEQGYQFALQAQPDHRAALLNLGALLEQGNRLDDLDSLLAGAAAAGVTGDEIDCLRALALRRKGQFEEAFALVRPIGPEHVDERMTTQLVAQLADRIGETDVAFDAFTRMNGLMARDPLGRVFDGTEHRRFVETVTNITTPEWHASWTPAEPASQRPAPVFLVGFPRSGTTLLDTVLMSHSNTHVLEEEPMLGRVRDEAGGIEGLARLGTPEVNALRRRYFEELDKISPPPPGKMVIDKLPLNILRTALIQRLFPDAKLIFALRHPCDVVLSCFMQNFKINRAMASFLTLRNSALLYDAVMTNWMRSQEVFDLQVHTVRYEGMVADREAVLRPLFDFLGLPWEDGVMEHERTASDRGYIRTPSYAAVTEGIYSRAKGRWERYGAHMADVLPILAPWVERFGYEPIETVRG